MRYKKINRKENYSMNENESPCVPFGWGGTIRTFGAGAKILCLTAWLHPNDYTIFVWRNYIIVPYL